MLEFNAQTIAFVIFSLFILGGGLGVVTTRNLIHGTLYLILSLFGVAGFFVLLSAPFLASVQVLVYIGAIAILIVFAVMLTRSMTRLRDLYNEQWLLSGIAGALLFGVLAIGVILPVWGQSTVRRVTSRYPIWWSTRLTWVRHWWIKMVTCCRLKWHRCY